MVVTRIMWGNQRKLLGNPTDITGKISTPHTSVVSIVSQPPIPTALLVMQSGKQLRNEQDPDPKDMVRKNFPYNI